MENKASIMIGNKDIQEKKKPEDVVAELLFAVSRLTKEWATTQARAFLPWSLDLPLGGIVPGNFDELAREVVPKRINITLDEKPLFETKPTEKQLPKIEGKPISKDLGLQENQCLGCADRSCSYYDIMETDNCWIWDDPESECKDYRNV